MNIYSILGFPLLILAVLDFILVLLLLRNNPQNKNINKAVAILCSSMAVYSLAASIVYFRAGLGLDFTFFYKCCWVGWLGIPPLYQYLYYIKDDKSKKAFGVGIAFYSFWLIIWGLCFTTDWMQGSIKSLVPYIPYFGPLERPVRLIGGVILFHLIYRLFKTRNEVSGIKKIQTNYLILGMLIYAVGGIITSSLFSLFGGFGFDPALTAYFSLPLTLLIYYAITRYRLFDIQVIISNALATMILIVILGGLNIVIFRLVEPQIGAIWASFISMCIIAIIFLTTPLRRTVQGSFNDVLLGERYNYQLILRESTQAIISMLDQEDLLNYLVHLLQQSFKIHKACLFLKYSEGPYFIRHHWGWPQEFTTSLQLTDEKIIEWLKKNKQVFIKEEQQGLFSEEDFNLLYDGLHVIDAQVILPLFFKENLIGFLTLGGRSDGGHYTQRDIDILQTMSAQTAIAIENARLYSETMTDQLTGLYHRNYFMSRLQVESERVKRYMHPLSLLLLDIDNFKSINDICGHLAGDKVLVGVANLIKKNIRCVDIIARYGGEKFAIILPETNQYGALIASRRLKEIIEKTPFEDNIFITASIGIASLNLHMKNMEDFISAADKALHKAKQNGKNLIEMAE